MKDKKELLKRLDENLDILAGSVIVNYLKCGKNCVCKKGRSVCVQHTGR